MTLHATYFGANGWLLEFEGLRVLVDPWLTGPLRFPPGDWFFRGELPHPWPVPEGLDLLLLTQGLPDHCHPASLSLLDRQLPVVGSSSAAARARALGFTRVTAVSPGQEHSHGPLQIQATAGAPVPQVENGYRLVHPAGSIYLEPHGFLATDPATAPRGPVDVAITPVVDLGLPLAGAFVKGAQVLPQLLERLQPAVVLASTAGGDVRFQGWLSQILWQKGSTEQAAAVVGAATVSATTASGGSSSGSMGETGPERCRLIDPVPGERYVLSGCATTTPV
ncbi:MBL fold metallo-hydrolase [Synechococcus sp. CCY9201]|uniref:MBL fold metallo-hydrolase n=1 Tax=unclassified Synechococcus TaxID=2626047 RepID=UPI002AD4B8CB|nr:MULTISPECIES: MBL fold metallo-hydrolase [unclassified Synechococcus]MEA5473351.1 MBL fold metallo-hydrolase [Synechococcus sp. CCY9201]CAK6692067.1 hypothetical protein IFHNHDMJ_01143 [Synechococcus sp. CBW1107]